MSQAVYQIPTAEEIDRSNSAYALQRLFYLLQSSSNAVGTTDLTQSFGWDTKQIFEQQDVQELSRVLMDKLDEKMKGTEAEGALTKMFVGKMKTYISCINVDYESSRIEDFWDIQLNVSGNKNLDDSFKDYIQVETMDGENKYYAEGYGLQDAKKGVIFESFPPVLHLQLKRFEYDFQRDAMMKVNDRYEFPEVWDASPYLSDGADRSESWIYHLHGVLVHSGDLNAGHYYAFLKPTKDGHYYKFDDDRVTRATTREALEENFGGDYQQANGNVGHRNPYTRGWSSKRSMSAYMLVYIRETRVDQVLIDPKVVVPPPHLAERLAEERAAFERKKKEREEAHLYMDIAVASDNNFKAYQGFDIVPWKGDTEEAANPKVYRVLRTTTMAEFTKTVGDDIEVDADMLRPWSMVNRQNGTVRPDTVLEFPDMTVEEAANKHGTKQSLFRLWVETAVKRDETGDPMFGEKLVDLKGQQNNRALMIFLKHFDAKEQTLYGAGTFYAALQDKVQDLSPSITRMLGWPAGTAIKLSEEIKLNMIEAMKPKVTLAASEIQDGDIITVQRVLPDKEVSLITSSGGCVEAKEFYDYLLNRITVDFVPRTSDSEDPSFTLTLSKKMTYNQFAGKVAEFLGTEPSHLRFTTVSAAGKPRQPVKYNANSTLNTILFPGPYSYSANATQRPDAMFYEILDMSLVELEQRKPIKITWLPEGLSKEEEHTLMIPKNAQVSDLLQALQKKANISDETMAKVRVYESHTHKYHKSLPADYQVMNLYDYTQLYAAPFPEEDSSRKISVFHFDREPSKAHGIPFQFALKEVGESAPHSYAHANDIQGEPFSETKQRLSDYTRIKGKQLDKIKFALVLPNSKAEYIENGKLNDPRDQHKTDTLADDEVLVDLLEGRETAALGLDHTNKSRSFWGKTDSIFIR
jgi:ubiquitin carboxyl-terminal hydrolase 7